MTYRIEKISTYDFRPSDTLLLDANIWLFIYGPQKPNNPMVEIYSNALKKILAAKSCIYIDVLVVSEFINTYARMRWNLLGGLSKNKKFKQFRKSSVFKAVAQDIASDVKCVLKHCTRVGSGFESPTIETLIDEFAAGDLDFNDQILAALCKNKGLKMVTHDADFRKRGIPVITANKRLLT